MDDIVHFIMPLKARSVAGSQWSRIEALFRDSVTALHAQTDPRFRLLVVGHDRPAVPDLPEGRTVRFLDAPFAPPEAEADHWARVRDKALKLGHALAAIAPQLGSAGGYVVFLDADDFVHRNLTGTLLEERPPFGVYFPRGLYYDDRLKRVWEIDAFHTICGTCAAIHLRADDIPSPDRLHALEDLEAFRALFWPFDWHHAGWPRRAAESGRPLAPLSFPGAVYRINTGANNHGPRRIRHRHRWPRLYPRFRDQGGTHWVHRPDLRAALADFGYDATGADR